MSIFKMTLLATQIILFHRIDGVDLADLVELLDLADRRTMQVPEKDLWMIAEQKDLQWIHQITPAKDTRVMEPAPLVAEHVERNLPAIRKEKEEIATPYLKRSLLTPHKSRVVPVK